MNKNMVMHHFVGKKLPIPLFYIVNHQNLGKKIWLPFDPKYPRIRLMKQEIKMYSFEISKSKISALKLKKIMIL